MYVTDHVLRQCKYFELEDLKSAAGLASTLCKNEEVKTDYG